MFMRGRIKKTLLQFSQPDILGYLVLRIDLNWINFMNSVKHKFSGFCFLAKTCTARQHSC